MMMPSTDKDTEGGDGEERGRLYENKTDGNTSNNFGT